MSKNLLVQVDSREQKFAHVTEQFDKSGIRWFVSKLVVGDYADFRNPTIVIDRKRNMQELHGNICQGHDRFRRELERARDLGIQLVFLVEHSRNIRTLSDVRHWKNPRRAVSPYALDGPELYKRLVTIETKYHTKFYFCDKTQTGKAIIQLLM